MYWMVHGECVKLLTGVHCGVIIFNSSRHNLFLSNFCQNVFKILTELNFSYIGFGKKSATECGLTFIVHFTTSSLKFAYISDTVK